MSTLTFPNALALFLLVILPVAPALGGDGPPVSCGVRVTYFIAKDFERAPNSLEETAQLIKQAADGASTLLGIHDGLEKLGISTEGRRLSFEELSNLDGMSIVTIKTDDGPHFAIFIKGAAENDGTVTLIDPPGETKLSRLEFLRQWNGIALVVTSVPKPISAPATTPVATPAAVASTTSWYTHESVRDLGRVILPTRDPITSTFTITNGSDHVIKVDRLLTSCGCTKVAIDKNELPAHASGTLTATIEPAGDVDVGAKEYRIAVTSVTAEVEPIVFIIRTNYVEMLSVRPTRLSFGQVLKSHPAEVRTVEILQGKSGLDKRVTSATSSVPWISALVDDNDAIHISVSPSLPIGVFRENVILTTARGAINLPVTGEGVGSFRVQPNPLVILGSSTQGSFHVMRAENGSFRAERLVLNYNKLAMSIVRNPENGEDQSYEVHFLERENGIATYPLELLDLESNSKVVINIVHAAAP